MLAEEVSETEFEVAQLQYPLNGAFTQLAGPPRILHDSFQIVKETASRARLAFTANCPDAELLYQTP